MSISSVHVPLEIIEQILCYLPAKSLGRFTCVSKPWKALISKPQLIEAHVNGSSRLQPGRIVGICDETFYTVGAVFAAESAAEPMFHPPDICLSELKGLCNGLVLAYGMGDLFLINPTTRDYAIVNNYPPKDGVRAVGGLGYDSKNDDYKIVEISYHGSRRFRDTVVTVYSMRNKIWREVVRPPNDYDKWTPEVGIYLNMRLHWLCTRSRSDPTRTSSWFIAAFNLMNEEFEELDLPSSLGHPYPYVFLCVSGYLCVCVCVWFTGVIVDVWVMKEYGVRESWKKISIHGFGWSSCFQPLWFMGDQEEVVLEVDHCRVVVYNVEQGTLRNVNLKACGLPSWFRAKGTYVESLVSPKHAMGLREDRS